MTAWQPTASRQNLQQRAAILATIRQFFLDRHVMEVETPLLGHSTATNPFIDSLMVAEVNQHQHPPYLQTSPEFPMKRLLAAGSGSIYQICKAFRAEENGRFHNSEFTMLEWYRVGFDHHQLMDEVDELLKLILDTISAERVTYAQLFQHFVGVDPHTASASTLAARAQQRAISIPKNAHMEDVDFWRQLLMMHYIEPHIGQLRPIFITDYPASQAALARIRPGNPPVAERFEVYFRGIELANAYHELGNPDEQRHRFQLDNQRRAALGLPQIPLDNALIAALAHGLPDCAGIALGIDRLVMLATQATSIAEVISFTAA